MLRAIIEAFFGCTHSRTTFPITPKNEATRVTCLDCGRKFSYDWKTMRRGRQLASAGPLRRLMALAACGWSTIWKAHGLFRSRRLDRSRRSSLGAPGVRVAPGTAARKAARAQYPPGPRPAPGHRQSEDRPQLSGQRKKRRGEENVYQSSG
jgi:hypothetical protein